MDHQDEGTHWNNLFVRLPFVPGTSKITVDYLFSDTTSLQMNRKATMQAAKGVAKLLRAMYRPPKSKVKASLDGTKPIQLVPFEVPLQANGEDCAIHEMMIARKMYELPFDVTLPGIETAMKLIVPARIGRFRSALSARLEEDYSTPWLKSQSATKPANPSASSSIPSTVKFAPSPMQEDDPTDSGPPTATSKPSILKPRSIFHDRSTKQATQNPPPPPKTTIPTEKRQRTEPPSQERTKMDVDSDGSTLSAATSVSVDSDDDEKTLADGTYVLLMILNRDGTFPMDRQFEGISTILSAAQDADSTFRFVPLDDKKFPPIKSKDELPDNDMSGQIRITNYVKVMDQKGLTVEQDPKKKQKDIWATARVKCDKRTTADICQILNPPLSSAGLRMMVKSVQSVYTRSDVAMMSVHEALDPRGIVEVLTDILQKMERGMIKKGLNKRFEGLPFPKIVTKSKNPWEPPSSTAPRYNLQRKYTHLKNAWHIEAATSDWERLFPIFVQARTTGVFTRLLGVEVDYIPIGVRTGRMGANKVNGFMRNVRSNMTHNITCGVDYLHGIIHPYLRFSVAYTDGRKPKRSEKSSIRDLLVGLRVYDTAAQLTSRPAIDQVWPMRTGPHKGEAAVVYYNDAKGVDHRKGRRQENGPITELMNKIQANPSAWIFGYGKEVMKYTEGTLRAMMQGVDEMEREVVDIASFDPQTMTVTSPLNAASDYADRAERRREELGISFSDADLAGMLQDKQKLDDEEAEAAKLGAKLMKDHNLYEDGVKRKVGASGVSQRTGASAASSQASECRSTDPMNLADNYRKTRLDLANTKAGRATDQAKIAELLRALEETGMDTSRFNSDDNNKTGPPTSGGTEEVPSDNDSAMASNDNSDPEYESEDASSTDDDSESEHDEGDGTNTSSSSRESRASSTEERESRGPRKP
jgi:hypothetical protein